MSAVISDCGRYRYRLERRPGDWGKQATFIMLNPSTADAENDDPTIRRCIGFARSWNCGTLVVVNLFAYRATKPGIMKMTADPVGPDNDRHIRIAAQQAREFGGPVVCAWGTHGSLQQRDHHVLAMLQQLGVEPQSLERTSEGFPKHPLYCRRDCTLEPYRGRDAR